MKEFGVWMVWIIYWERVRVFSLNSSENYDTMYQIGEQEEFLMANRWTGRISDGKPLINKDGIPDRKGNLKGTAQHMNNDKYTYNMSALF